MFTRSEYVGLQQEKRAQLLIWVTNFIWEATISSSFSSISEFLSQMLLYREITPVHLWRHYQHSIFTCYLLYTQEACEVQKDHTALSFATWHIQEKRASIGRPQGNVLLPRFHMPFRLTVHYAATAMGRVGSTDLAHPHRLCYLESKVIKQRLLKSHTTTIRQPSCIILVSSGNCLENVISILYRLCWSPKTMLYNFVNQIQYWTSTMCVC